MCLGVFSAIAGAVKTFYLKQLRSRADFTCESLAQSDRGPRSSKPNKSDTDDATSLMIWYTTEMYVIIIAGSLPTLRPLAQRAMAMSKTRSSKRKGYQQYPHTPEGNSHPLKPYNVKHSHHRSRLPTHLSDSDQNVLTSGITKTTDIAIDYDTRKSKNDKGQADWENHGDDPMVAVHAVGPVERV
ncbi:MAG: hypothetical protein Q9201_002150 [Fulgogasparrea decipioides]